jgi:uncharacterized protein (DUF433 family)
MRDLGVYGGQDPREMPAYGIREAAHYLLLPPSTLRDLINITQQGQIAMRSILRVYLSRIERDASGVPDKLYLFTRPRSVDEPKVIAMDPYVSFGRPVLVGTGITTAIIAERYKAGESIEELAGDYARPPHDIQEAIRCELATKAA